MDTLDFEVRYAVLDGGRGGPGKLEGTLLIYEQRALDRPEVFVKDSLHWPSAGISINLQHDRRQLVARTIPFVVEDEVRISADLPNTSAARDAAELVKTGTATGLSIEFRSEAEGRRGGMREIRRALLGAAALVDSPSHETTVEIRGANLVQVLEAAMGDDDRAETIQRMGEAAGISPSTVNNILMENIDHPPAARLRGFARALGVSESRLIDAVIADGANPELYGRESRWEDCWWL